MAEIQVNGGRAWQRKLVAQAASFYLSELLSKRLSNNIYVEINLVRKYKDKTGTKGDCIWDDQRVRPREFEINLDSAMNMPGLLEGLAHECVHVRQYATGDLQDTSNFETTLWKGEVLDSNTPYYEQPWEKEAYSKEQGLYAGFLDEYGYRKRKWVVDGDYLINS